MLIKSRVIIMELRTYKYMYTYNSFPKAKKLQCLQHYYHHQQNIKIISDRMCGAAATLTYSSSNVLFPIRVN